MYPGAMAVPAGGAEDILRSVLESGVRLIRAGDQLSYKVAAGSVWHTESQQFAASAKQIITVLRRISGEQGTGAVPNQRVDYAPLGFSQLIHWKLHELRAKKSLRGGVPIRLNGTINISALEQAIDAMVARHEALRTRIGMVGGAPIQVIPASVRWKLDMHDLTVLPAHAREAGLQRVIEKYLFEPIDVVNDPLFETALIRLSADEHVLVITMDHLISDGASVDIILREFSEIYECIIENRRLSLPAIHVQFADYAVWQKRMYKAWLDEHGPHWTRHLAGCRPMTLPKDRVSSNRRGLGFVRLVFDRALRTELMKWSRARRTTMVLGMFSAFVALVLRWYGTSEVIIQYQTNGRYTPEVENTLGYFAFRLFLRIRLYEKDTFTDLLERVQAEFVAAYEHKEFSSMQVYADRADLTGVPCFNWIPLDPIENKLHCGGEQGKVKCSRVRVMEKITNLEDVKTDTELMAIIRDEDEEIGGVVQFSRQTASFDVIERFGRNFAAFVQALLWRSDKPIAEMRLVP